MLYIPTRSTERKPRNQVSLVFHPGQMMLRITRRRWENERDGGPSERRLSDFSIASWRSLSVAAAVEDCRSRRMPLTSITLPVPTHAARIALFQCAWPLRISQLSIRSSLNLESTVITEGKRRNVHLARLIRALGTNQHRSFHEGLSVHRFPDEWKKNFTFTCRTCNYLVTVPNGVKIRENT